VIRLAAIAIASLPLLLSACAGRPTVRLEGIESERTLAPRYVTAVYRAVDENTADIFLSDLPAEQIEGRLTNAASGYGGSPGVVIHIHMFLMPVAGRTPIEFTASNVSLTSIVMTGEAVGVYGGGGVCLPSTRVGASPFKATLRDATLRLVESDPGFDDRLGATEASGFVWARRDDHLATRIGERMALLLASR